MCVCGIDESEEDGQADLEDDGISEAERIVDETKANASLKILLMTSSSLLL